MTHQSAEIGQRVASADRAWLRMDHPTNLMTINGLLFFGRRLNRVSALRVLEERLLRLARFGDRVIPSVGRSGHDWETVTPDMDYHLVEHELDYPGDDVELQNFVGSWMSSPFDFSQPLWRLHLIHNYKQGSVLYCRLHHCIGDGLALMVVLLSLTDMTAEPQGGAEANPLTKLFGPNPPPSSVAKEILEEVMPAAAKILTSPAEQLESLKWWQKGGAFLPAFGRLAFRPPDSRTLFKGRLGARKKAVWSDSVPLSQVNAIRQVLGGTVNDVLTNAVAGGLRRYLEARGGLRHRLNFRVVVPVSLRPVEEMASLGNYFGLVFLALPVGIADPRQRLAELQRRMSRLKRSFEPVVSLWILRLIGALPLSIQELVVRIFGAKGTAVLTNVPGPLKTLYFAGEPIESFLFWVPGRFGMGISIASYSGQVRVGLATDAGLVPDPEAIVAGFHQEFNAMLRLSGSIEA